MKQQIILFAGIVLMVFVSAVGTMTIQSLSTLKLPPFSVH